ncbi:MAG: lipoyl(octanoyl) transferase LipB [Spirochaetia bacterium]|nr:lipoyl(octanoyl) transferase LipB [Spirochaetia bacterium]MCF7952682.1 lipoyl(octanoyl) transferase LipB [Spirochaetales bacterium]
MKMLHLEDLGILEGEKSPDGDIISALNSAQYTHASNGSGTFGNEEPLYIDCGVMAYREMLDLQSRLQSLRIRKKIPNTILFVEHPPVITLGARKPINKLLHTEKELLALNIDVVQIKRGGGATAHNPGQLVMYPILLLPSLGLRVALYIRLLEQTGIQLLREIGIPAARKHRYPGIWVEERKIASIGVQLNYETTMHGIALNITNDLNIFTFMVPCGLDGVEMTSAEKELQRYKRLSAETQAETQAETLSMETMKMRMGSICSKYLSNLDELKSITQESRL